MCGDMGKAVLGALTSALLCGLVSDAAYLQRYEHSPQRYEQAPQRYEPAPQRYEPAPQRYEPAPQLYEPQIQYDQDYFLPREQQYRRKPVREQDKGQDLRNVPGTPGVDFPIYHTVPETSFSCHDVPVHPGMYANVETGCQAYHVCHDGREGHQGASFLCTNGTLFDQAKFACDWWYNVDCSQAIAHYKLNADPDKNPYTPKKKVEEEPQHYEGPQHHQAPQRQAPHHQAAYHQAPNYQAPHHQVPDHQDYGIYYRDV